MARLLLIACGAAWLLAGLAGLALAAFGTEAIERLLPPLVIDTDALRAAIVSVGVALIAVAAVHAVVVIGLGAGRHLAWTGAVLLSAFLAAMFLALAATAATSAAADPEWAGAYLAAAAAASLGAAAYGLVTVRLLGTRRSGSAD